MVRSAAKGAPVEALLITLMILVLVQSVTGSSEVTTPYSCCPSPQISFNPRCEQQWIINGTTIARFQGERRDFMSPCKEVKDDLVMLDRCVDVNVTITCVNHGVAVEQRIRYRGEPCPTPISGSMAPGNQGCVPLLLLLLAALVLMLVR